MRYDEGRAATEVVSIENAMFDHRMKFRIQGAMCRGTCIGIELIEPWTTMGAESGSGNGGIELGLELWLELWLGLWIGFEPANELAREIEPVIGRGLGIWPGIGIVEDAHHPADVGVRTPLHHRCPPLQPFYRTCHAMLWYMLSRLPVSLMSLASLPLA